MVEIDLWATLCPSFGHFRDFAFDPRLAGIRFNSAQIDNFELSGELRKLEEFSPVKPISYDVKGRQLRVKEIVDNPNYLEIILNHPINVRTPVDVSLKQDQDFALLDRLEDGGRRLIFSANPRYKVKVGESLHIKDPGLEILGSMFTPEELMKIEKVKAFGFKRYFLSYVHSQAYVDEFREIVGRDAEVWLKIEDEAGLRYVAEDFKSEPNVHLVAARGDLFGEIDNPHTIGAALKLIIDKDPEALVGSRIMLSVIPPRGWREMGMIRKIRRLALERLNDADFIIDTNEILNLTKFDPNEEWPVEEPSCADFLEIERLYSLGYRKMMLCDELCLRPNLLDKAVEAFDRFRIDFRG